MRKHIAEPNRFNYDSLIVKTQEYQNPFWFILVKILLKYHPYKCDDDSYWTVLGVIL